MPYKISGVNSMGKWAIKRPNKIIAQKYAKRLRKVRGNKNVRVYKVKK